MSVLFHKDQQQPTPAASQSDTIIGTSVTVEGILKSEGNIFIYGRVSGTVQTTQQLVIGADAVVRADIKAGTIDVQGEVRGTVEAADLIELSGSAKVFGDISGKRISVQAGASLQGNCHIGEVAPESEPATAPEASTTTVETPA